MSGTCDCPCPKAETTDIFEGTGKDWHERKDGNHHTHPPCPFYHKGAMCPAPKEQAELFR
jgi:hypothetical protein